MTVKISFPDMVEGAVRNPVPLVVGNEDFIFRADSDSTGGTKPGGEGLEVPLSV